jgi:hypothetical protein
MNWWRKVLETLRSLKPRTIWVVEVDGQVIGWGEDHEAASDDYESLLGQGYTARLYKQKLKRGQSLFAVPAPKGGASCLSANV